MRYLMAGLAGIVAFLALTYLGFSTGEAFYLAFVAGSTTAAILALTEKEKAVGELITFMALIFIMGVLPALSPIATSTFTIATPTLTVTIPSSFVPWIALSLIAFMAVMSIFAEPTRLALWVLSIILVVLYYVVAEPLVKLMFLVLLAIISSYPMLTKMPLLVPLGLTSNNVTVDLSSINPVIVLLYPLLTLLSLDPFNLRVNKTVRDIASVIAVFIVLLHVVEIFLTV